MVDRKDLGAGMVFIAFGAIYGGISLQSLPVGEALNMGPGYFPIILSALLILIGLAVGFRSLRALSGNENPFRGIRWRAVIMLSLSTVVFATFLEQLGMLPGIFLTSMVAAYASSQTRLIPALATSLGIALFCTAIFNYGIHLPVPVFGSWFSA